MNLEQLKAKAYDLLVLLEQTQFQLNETNKQIANYKENTLTKNTK
jgi:hypothetical protein